MTIDAGGLSYTDIFKQLRDAVSNYYATYEDVLIFVEAYEYEKCNLIKGFVEILLGCKTRVEESCGYYVLKVFPEVSVTAL